MLSRDITTSRRHYLALAGKRSRWNFKSDRGIDFQGAWASSKLEQAHQRLLNLFRL